MCECECERVHVCVSVSVSVCVWQIYSTDNCLVLLKKVWMDFCVKKKKKGAYDHVDVNLNLFDCTVVHHCSTTVQICKIYMILFKDAYCICLHDLEPQKSLYSSRCWNVLVSHEQYSQQHDTYQTLISERQLSLEVDEILSIRSEYDLWSDGGNEH